MFDSGHFMITNPDLKSEKEAALYIRECMKRLGKMRALVKGIHLSCSLSGAYIRQFRRGMPVPLTNQVMMRHICSLDHHDPFQTRAAREIVEAIEPDYVTHELLHRYGGSARKRPLQAYSPAHARPDSGASQPVLHGYSHG